MTLLAFAATVVLLSCKAQTIPTAPPVSTDTPTSTRTATVTKTPTGTPTVTNTPNATQTVAATESMIPTGTPSSTPTSTATATPTPTPGGGLLPGSVVFTAFITDGNAQQAFAPLVSLNSGITIYLTNMAWDPTQSGLTTYSGQTGNFVSSYGGANSTSGTTYNPEGILQYVSGASVPAFTTLFSWQSNSKDVTGASGQTANGSDSFTGLGGASGVTFLLDSTNAIGDKLFAFTAAGVSSGGVVTGPVTFLAGLIWGEDTWTTSGSISSLNYYDTYLPNDLVNGGVTYATDLFPIVQQQPGRYQSLHFSQYEPRCSP